jgi:electron transfer flavoprotein alpha subunit
MAIPILIIAEHSNNALNTATLHAITAASELSNEITVLVAGHHCQMVTEAASHIQHVTRVFVADAAPYAHFLPENLAPLIAKLSADFTHVLAPATTFGKNILPRVAALRDVAPISDVIKIVSSDTFVRLIYAGNALATVQSSDVLKIITVRTTAFEPATVSHTSAPIIQINDIFDRKLSEFIQYDRSPSLRPELTDARVIVSGGRGLKNAEQFKLLLEALADRLGAAIGASRAAVDAGFIPNDYQVGQTGKIVAPELYIAVGISGAIQHIAGMKDSKIIVAINKDPDAPIFQIADYGLLGDLFEIIPELCEALDRLKAAHPPR